jgi:hypothetical protein
MSSGPYNPDQLIFSWAEPPANPSALQDSAKDCTTPAEDSCLPTLRSLGVYGLDGLCGKTSPVSCHPTEDGILVPSSGRWGNSGTGGPTGSLTLNTAEWTDDGPKPSRSAGDECSLLVATLSEILEVKNVPPRFSLSARACAGILRRAERRGKCLPPMLKQALERAAGGMGPIALAH